MNTGGYGYTQPTPLPRNVVYKYRNLNCAQKFLLFFFAPNKGYIKTFKQIEPANTYFSYKPNYAIHRSKSCKITKNTNLMVSHVPL